MAAGLHVPLIPLAEVVGSAGTVAPVHTVIDVPKLKVGVMLGLTVMLKVTGAAHSPASGVNV